MQDVLSKTIGLNLQNLQCVAKKSNPNDDPVSKIKKKYTQEDATYLQEKSINRFLINI